MDKFLQTLPNSLLIYRGGGWGAEERDSSNPIAKGSNFEILILAEPSEIKVSKKVILKQLIKFL